MIVNWLQRIANIRWLLAALACIWLAAPASAEETFKLKLGVSSADSPTDPYALGAHLFAKDVKEASKGRIEVSFFPNRQIGDEKELMEGLRFGTIDMAIITNAVVANTVPALQLNDMPFLFSSAKQAQDILDGPIGAALRKKLDKKGVVHLGFMEGGFRNMINNVRPVAVPSDVKGVKYRTMQNPVYIDMFKALGGNPVPMAWGEVFSAVQQGALDGLEIPSAVIDSAKMYEITKYMSLTRHTYSVIHLMVSKKVFKKMPADLQKAMIEAGKKATGEQRAQAAANERKIIADLKAKGFVINEIKDPAQFREAVLPVYKRFKKSIGGDLLDKTLAAVKKK
ncbi:MAG: TRAP transporter substrate-binding protein [Hyphomicrobiaceae bacterium]